MKRVEIVRSHFREHVDKVEFARRKLLYGDKAFLLNNKTERVADENSLVSLNESIGILQRAYSRAINKQTGGTGSVFRKKCKAKDGWVNEVITEKDYRFFSGNEYSYKCLAYIHKNPVEADLVSRAIDWKFSSARDYPRLRKGTICNLEFGKQIINFI